MAKKGGKKFGTVIQKCGGFQCVSAFQDATYGKFNRLMNVMGKPTGNAGTVNVRCTICLKTHTSGKEATSDVRTDSDKPVAATSGKIKAGKPKDDKRDGKAQKGRKG